MTLEKLYLISEDEVTRRIAMKLLEFCEIEYKELLDLPVRGGQIKKDFPKYNQLPGDVFCLIDLDDTYCPPQLKSELLAGDSQSENFIINIAVTEAEAWLMADRHGIAKFLSIPDRIVPQPKAQSTRRPDEIELEFPCKPSLYLMNTLVSQSSDREIRDGLTPVRGAKKGKLYNSIMSDFIINHWDIERAAKHSTSLRKSIQRIGRSLKVRSCK